MKRTPIIICSAIAALSGVANAGLLDMVRQADAITIANVSPEASGPEGAHFLLEIRHVLKGTVGNRNIMASFVPTRGPSATLDVAPVCGIFLLRQDGSRWYVIPLGEPLRFDAMYMPSDRCWASGDVAENFSADPVIGEYLHSVLTDPLPSNLYRLFSLIRSRESGQISTASRAMSTSANADLRALGLSWQIAEGDSAAVQALAADPVVLRRPAPTQIMLVTSLSAYSNVDSNGVAALGGIAQSDSGGLLEQAVSFALRQIHSRDALPYAVQLLGSQNAKSRENAIAALSMYVLEVPPLDERNGAAVFERALNPSTRKRLDADESAHTHFGQIPDSSTESALIHWWRDR